MSESSETNATAPKSREELILGAAAHALNSVVRQGATLPPEAIVRAYREGTILPGGLDGELAMQIAKTFQQGSGDRISQEQLKWFALGLATQAQAATQLDQLGVQE